MAGIGAEQQPDRTVGGGRTFEGLGRRSGNQRIIVRVVVWLLNISQNGRVLSRESLPVDENKPAPGAREIVWHRRDDRGETVRRGVYIYRVTIDDEAESRVIALR